jgi:hypothetical protein
MQEVLRDQKENAFLSRDLAHIVTELSIPEIPFVPFAPGISNISYIDLLRQYEFKTLYVDTTPPVVRILPELKIEEIQTLGDLEAFQATLTNTAEKKLILSTDTFAQVFAFGIDNRIYRVDSTRVDIYEFITWLFAQDDITLV